jgi:hypothetical protein
MPEFLLIGHLWEPKFVSMGPRLLKRQRFLVCSVQGNHNILVVLVSVAQSVVSLTANQKIKGLIPTRAKQSESYGTCSSVSMYVCVNDTAMSMQLLCGNIHSFIHSLIYLFIYSFIHSFIHYSCGPSMIAHGSLDPINKKSSSWPWIFISETHLKYFPACIAFEWF